MRIEERIPRREKENLCHVVIENLDIVRRSLESIILSNSHTDSASKQVKDQMLNVLIENGWSHNIKINKHISEVYPMANYVLDAMKDIKGNDCSHLHRFFVEFCFDNRQAIGSNILKFEVASRNAIQFNLDPIPILICAEQDTLKHFGWDGSIANANEYEHALRIAYKDIINHPAIILALMR
jgi:hypothetical protein